MSIKDKLSRLKESIRAEKDPDVKQTLKAIGAGMANFYINNKKINDLAKQRYERFCNGCDFNEPENVVSLAVTDNSLPELSGKKCTECGGCTLSYKLRQSIKPCKLWKEND
ncbi:hypothetical protein [Elizabethkingia phage TCUEAP1]|nr:hypothetical protein [Elizabethkingia phage TCUEAP1]